MILGDLLKPLIGPAVEKVLDLIPNANERARAKEELERNVLKAANDAALAQIRVNEAEAGHASIFVAGWRPFIGWVCGFGLAWAFLGHPLFVWGASLSGVAVEPPGLQTEALISLVMAMLGMAGWRTLDKINGAARSRIGRS